MELWLAWKRVAREIVEGTLGSDFDRADAILRGKIVEFVDKGDFGLASGNKSADNQADGAYDRIWYKEFIAIEEVAFESGVFLLFVELLRFTYIIYKPINFTYLTA